MPTIFLFYSRHISEFAVVVANNATGHGQLGFGNRSVTHISAESIFKLTMTICRLASIDNVQSNYVPLGHLHASVTHISAESICRINSDNVPFGKHFTLQSQTLRSPPFGNRSVTHISAQSIFKLVYDNLPFGKH